ncbi:MAG: hypothetical protein MI923_15400 [Phycisphaerales bacterium]|nr:hypothetical protein [Phycisphaerales bacterium]
MSPRRIGLPGLKGIRRVDEPGMLGRTTADFLRDSRIKIGDEGRTAEG